MTQKVPEVSVPAPATAMQYNLSDRIEKIVITMMAVGTVFVFSAGASLSQQWSLDRIYTHPGLRHLFFLPLAIAVMFLVARIDHQHLSFRNGLFRSFTPYLLMTSIIMLVLVIFIGPRINSARRWLIIGMGAVQISFQPSELAKWSMIFFCAAACAHADFHISDFKRQFIPLVLIIVAVVVLILKEDFGTAAFVSLLCFCLLFAGGTRYLFLFSPVPLAALGFYLALFQYPHRLKRIFAFLNPEKYPSDLAYQATQSLVAMGSGGILGKGLGGGICKYGHLPEDTTDFVFAVIGEELGIFGTVGTILLFALFTFYGLLVIARCRNDFSRLLATGIVLAIAIQAAINIGVVTVVLPTKGIPLPFISRGGTSLLLSAAAVGVLINIARQTDEDRRIHSPTA
jgi:cell division protein FtsW